VISIRDAAAAAEAMVRELYTVDEIIALRLEEVERSENGADWVITLGWHVPAARPANTLLGAFGPLVGERIYKRFVVDGSTGAVKSMAIRSLPKPT
jgi:hypothetical protein